MIRFADIEAAARRLAPHIHRTPLERQHTLSEQVGHDVYLKMENLQRTGSFKVRGALNRICLLDEARHRQGIVAASAGNHAQGVALAGALLGIDTLVYMPRWAPAAKIAAARGYGATVELEGSTYDDARKAAYHTAEALGRTHIHAFDDPAVIAGQGTVALEAAEQTAPCDTVLVPVGGGGLISGIAVALHTRWPQARIVGVQAEGASSMAASRARGLPVEIDEVSTIADGIAVKKPGGLTYPIVDAMVDEVVTVTDDEIAGAILTCIERLKLVVEGAGAVGIAALLSGKVRSAGPRTLVVVSGGNIDVDMLARIIERGLVCGGRRLRLRVTLQDRPGSLHKLTGVVAEAQGNILAMGHDRANVDVPIGLTEVEMSVTVHDIAHGKSLIRRLEDQGYAVRAEEFATAHALDPLEGSTPRPERLP